MFLRRNLLLPDRQRDAKRSPVRRKRKQEDDDDESKREVSGNDNNNNIRIELLLL